MLGLGHVVLGTRDLVLEFGLWLELGLEGDITLSELNTALSFSRNLAD